MVKIEITCKDGYAAKEYTRDDGTLAYFLKGPNAVSNDQGEVGRYDIRGKFAGKFKTAVGARKRFGVLDGRTVGSLKLSSKLGLKSTVSFSISTNISPAIAPSRASVYLIAAAGSLSMLPKLPWPSTSMYLIEKSCASLTMAS